MKTLFIPAKSKIDISIVLKKVKIKGKLGLITTAQFLQQLPKAKKVLKNSIIAGQILGCNVSAAEKIKNKVNAFLYIGSGKFHPIQAAIKTNKPVYIANPNTNEFSKISKEEIERKKREQKGKLLRFLSSEKLGILVSTKPGQNNLKKALSLQKKLKKESFIFMFNTLNIEELENFRDIDCWINTACPRIEGKKIINMDVVPNFK